MPHSPAELRETLGLAANATDLETEIALAESLGDEDRAAELRATQERGGEELAELDADQAHQAVLEVEQRQADAHRDEPSPAQTEPKGRLSRPGETRSVYMVLWAPKPPRGERPAYKEAAYVKASSDATAKRVAITADDAVGVFLREQAGQRPGILLRAVPAISWPDTIEPTTYERPAPRLVIR